MEKYVFLIFILLCAALALPAISRGAHVLKAKIARFFIVIAALLFYVLWFVKESSSITIADSNTIEIVNKLPQTLDFHIIKVMDSEIKKDKYEVKHIGKIRSEYYRTENINVKNSDQYWVAGFVGKKNMVYFSQHSILPESKKLVIEVNNYINQSVRLSKKADGLVTEKFLENNEKGIWVALSFLLIFLNTALLILRR